jgi:ethanolamine utilization protein EutN
MRRRYDGSPKPSNRAYDGSRTPSAVRRLSEAVESRESRIDGLGSPSYEQQDKGRIEVRSLNMRVAEVLGTVVLSRWHPTLTGSRLKLVVPLSLSELASDAAPAADEIVAWDDLGAGIGDRIAISEGAEASQPFRPDVKPIDAYNAAILDQISLKSEV